MDLLLETHFSPKTNEVNGLQIQKELEAERNLRILTEQKLAESEFIRKNLEIKVEELTIENSELKEILMVLMRKDGGGALIKDLRILREIENNKEYNSLGNPTPGKQNLVSDEGPSPSSQGFSSKELWSDREDFRQTQVPAKNSLPSKPKGASDSKQLNDKKNSEEMRKESQKRTQNPIKIQEVKEKEKDGNLFKDNKSADVSKTEINPTKSRSYSVSSVVSER